ARLRVARQGAAVPLDADLPGSRFDTRAVETRARRDYALLSEALGPFAALDGGDDESAARADAREHTWLRMAFGAETLDLDTTLSDAQPGDRLAAAESTAPRLPDEARHTVRLRLLIEELDGETLVERVLLDERLDAIDAASRELFLFFEPDISGLGGAILGVLSGDERWSPVFMSDGQSVTGESFSSGGPGVDILGDPTELPELVSLRLLVSTNGPGLETQESTRVIFERRAGPDPIGTPVTSADLDPLALKDGVPQALTGAYNILVSTGGGSPRTYAYRLAQVLDFIAAALLDPEVAAAYSKADRLWPMAMLGQGLVQSSEQVMVPGAGGLDGHAYVARPRVYLQSLEPALDEVDTIVRVTDLMLDSVRVLPDRSGASTAQQHLWYGVLQAALETEAGLLQAAGLDSEIATLESASLSMREPLSVLTSAMASLPTGLHPAMRADIENGLAVVVAGDAAAADEWWSVDPDTGQTRAMLVPGLRGYRVALDERPGNDVFDTSKAKHMYGGRRTTNRAIRGPGGVDRVKGYNPRDYQPPRRPGLPQNQRYRPPRTRIPTRPSPIPTCRGGQEYTVVLGCASLPARMSFYTLGAVEAISIAGIVYGLLKQFGG
ncbi:MAG: hypothetical protein ACC726_03070, partial [Chloroflexota bacterium]